MCPLDELDLNSQNDYSEFPGSTNTILFKLSSYVKTIKKAGGLIPE